MSGDHEPLPASQNDIMPLSHTRILVIMAVLGVVAAVAGYFYVSTAFSGAVLFGTALAFVNYYWLKVTLRRLFTTAAEGEKPKVSAIRYFTRYIVLGSIIAFIYATEILPITGVILGIAGFGFATVVEGIIRIFTGFFNEREI